jgi:acyl carrier protein
VRERIEAILRSDGQLGVDPAELGPNDNLYVAGMTSFASVNVMLALEDEFGIEFPDRMLSRTVFSTIGNLERAIGELTGKTVGAQAR